MENRFSDELRKMGIPQSEIDIVDRLMDAVHQRLGIDTKNPSVDALPKVLFLYRVFQTIPIARALGLEPPITAEILHAAADAIELAHKGA